MLGVWIISSTNELLVPTAIALGNFDGVHLGHQRVLRQISAFHDHSPSLHPTVVCFNPHPREFFTGQHQPLLTPPQEKVEQLEQLGITQLILLPFTQTLARFSPFEFVEQILVQQLQTRVISVGADFRFGYQRQGTVEDLMAIAAQFGIQVLITDLKTDQQQRISSSRIREALAEGKMQQAKEWLGRPYGLIGKVVLGQQLGHKLGFPTANLKLPVDKLLPRFGVYAVQVTLLDASITSSPKQMGVMNIGDRPTVSGTKITAEVHLFNWSADLYGQHLKVELLEFLRPERKFANLEELKVQIAEDCRQAQGRTAN